MLNYLFFISCALAAVHGNFEVDSGNCRSDDSTYTYSKGEFEYFLKPNEIIKVKKVVPGFLICTTLDDRYTPKTGFECIQRLINVCTEDDVYETPDLSVIDVSSKFLFTRETTPYKVIKFESVYVENDSDREETSYTSITTYNSTESFEFSMGQKTGIKAAASFNIPLIAEASIEVSPEFNFGEKWTDEKPKSFTFSSLKVVVPPRSRVKLTYEIGLTKLENKFVGSFTLDKDNEILKKCYTSKPNLNLEKPGMIDEVTAIFTENLQTLNNVPMFYITDRFEHHIEVIPEPLSPALNNPAIPTIGILDLPSFDIFNPK